MSIQLFIKISTFCFLATGITTVPICNLSSVNNAEESKTIIDIQTILERKQLIALTDNSTTSYFIYKGEPMGFEYEMLRDFAKNLNVNLKIIVAKNMDDIFYHLISGHVDIVAANLTVTEERMHLVNFSEPVLYTRQVLIQRKPDGWEKMSSKKLNEQLIRTAIDLDKKDIYVRKGSSFYSRLKNLQDEIAGNINIIEAPGEATTEELITMVAEGKIPYTIADENVAMVNQTYYPQIDIETAISFPQKIAWAVRKSSPLLLAELNCWLEKTMSAQNYVFLYNKYFKNTHSAELRKGSEFSSLGGNKISEYDDLIRAYSKELGWDWRLLTSMVYQESRFNPDAHSWMGACGLMQMIPSTAVKYGIDTCGATPIESIDAGTKHLQYLDKYWSKHIDEKNERVKFVLASYNAGLGHVIDARNLAKKYGKNPDVWFGNVEKYILLKSNPAYYNDPVARCGYCRGQEPYNYVRSILTRYEHYKNIIKDEA